MAGTKKAGRSFPVKVAQMSGDVKTLKVTAGTTIRQALEKAGLDPKNLGGGLRVNGGLAKLGQRVKKGDFITVAARVQGGL